MHDIMLQSSLLMLARSAAGSRRRTQREQGRGTQFLAEPELAHDEHDCSDNAPETYQPVGGATFNQGVVKITNNLGDTLFEGEAESCPPLRRLCDHKQTTMLGTLLCGWVEHKRD